MTSEVTDVLQAVQSFIANGYDREYRVKDGNLVDLELGSILDACNIRVDAALRLESGDDGEDASNIYAITDPATRHKGLLVDAFDVVHEICTRDLSERLVEHRETASASDGDVPTKHGLRKVFKDEFHRDPERYVLREGFPDFPPCPFGQSFSILGVRRQNIRHNSRRRLAECGLRLGVDVRRRVCGVASAYVRWSFA